MNKTVWTAHWRTLKRDLHHSVDLIIERYRSMYEANAHASVPEVTVHEWFNEPLPESSIDVADVLTTVSDTVIAHPTMNLGTKMFAYVMSGGNQVSVIADLLSSALNQNAA